MKTAVEWLEEQLTSIGVLEMPQGSNAVTSIINEAKEMEKQQMKDAVLSQCTTHEGLRKIFDKQFEQYYNETFKTK